VAIDSTTGYSVGRTGERVRSLADRAQDVVNVADFAVGGMYPWNADDSSGINSAIAEANARSNAGGQPLLWFPPAAGVSGYRTNSKLTTLNGTVDVIMDVPIVVHSSFASINDFVWTIGDPSYRSNDVDLHIWMTFFGAMTNYAINPNFGGVQLINPAHARARFRSMAGFHTPIQVKATGAGQYVTGCVFDLGMINGVHGLDLVADGAGCWMISNTFINGQIGHDASGYGVNRSGIRMRSINGALAMHDLRFHDVDIELGNDGVNTSYAFETVGSVSFIADGLYLEGNSGFLKSDGGGYCQAMYNIAESAGDTLITEPTFSGSTVISREQVYGNAVASGSGNRTLGRNHINSQQRNTGGAAIWTINKFIGTILINNVGGSGAITLAAGSGVVLNVVTIPVGKLASLVGLGPLGSTVVVVVQA